MSWQRWVFRFLDTCFFRDAAPFHAGEGGYTSVRSIFPPSITTLQGAIRTSLALERGWRPGDMAKWPAELGGPDDLGNLRLRGPYLLCQDEPYFPIPLLLLRRESNYTRLCPGDAVECDLGRVRLPYAMQNIVGAKLVEGVYLSKEGLKQILEGGIPSQGEIKKREDFYVEELRVGLERSDNTRTAKEGHLYNSVHVRPKRETALAVYVSGTPSAWRVADRRTVPLGGEARLASVEIKQGNPSDILPPVPSLVPGKDGKIRFTAILVTPGWYGEGEGLKKVIREGPPGIPGRCVAACIGKIMQVGGWDMLNRQPRPLIPVLPPGSLWFYEADAQEAARVAGLHGQCISPKGDYGFGQIIIGRWEEKE